MLDRERQDLYGLYNRPISSKALTHLKALPDSFVLPLSKKKYEVLLDCFFHLDRFSKGRIVPNTMQLETAMAVGTGADVIVRASTGSGKTLAMILAAMAVKKMITISIAPLQLIQDNHKREFEEYGIPTLVVNHNTSKDPRFWQYILVNQPYQHFTVSPEQCGYYKSHLSPFAKLVRNPQWSSNIGLLNVDEGHFTQTAGQLQDPSKVVFRPAYTDLGQRLRVHLPPSAPCAVFTASLPPPVLSTVTRTLRLHDNNTKFINLTTNRPNLIYAVRPLVGSPRNYENLRCLIPSGPNPTLSQLKKTLVFLDSKKACEEASAYLNSLLPAALQELEPIRHYHAGMSDKYRADTFEEYRRPNGNIRILLSTESASNGVNVSDIELVVLCGVKNRSKSVTIIDLEQRGGRGGRRPDLLCLVLVLVEDEVLSSDVDLPLEKEMMDFCRAKAPHCRRQILAKFNGDETTEALVYQKWCCDNHSDGFNINDFLPSPLLSSSDASNLSSMSTIKTRSKTRPKKEREELEKRLIAFRENPRHFHDIHSIYSPDYVLSCASIASLVKVPSDQLTNVSSLVAAIDATEEWGLSWGTQVLNIVHKFDFEKMVSKPQQSRRTPRAKSNKENIASERSESDGATSKDGEDWSGRPQASDNQMRDVNGFLQVAASRTSSPMSSREPTPPPVLVASSGRYATRAASGLLARTRPGQDSRYSTIVVKQPRINNTTIQTK